MKAVMNWKKNSVYERLCRSAMLLASVLGCMLAALPARAQSGDAPILDARESFRKKDGMALAAARDKALAERHPLAMWADYWELNSRLSTATQDELSAFYARWPDTYVEDRLRNDWLLELGKRRDWAHFAAEYPRFRMNDDREVSCYALLLEQQAGRDVRAAASAAWQAQRDGDEGCALLAATLVDAKLLQPADIWRKLRRSVEAGRVRASRQAALLIDTPTATGVIALIDNPARYLSRKGAASGRNSAELSTLALIRMAVNDPEAAALQLSGPWDRALPADLARYAWRVIAKQSAIKLLPEASEQFRRAEQRVATPSEAVDWPDDALAWKVRAGLRADNGRPRWQQVVQAINAMSEDEQRDPAWVYWKARGLQAVAGESQEGESMRALGRELLGNIAGQLDFYGKLAAEDLDRPQRMPPAPAPLTPAERGSAAQHPGLTRALQLIGLGLRSEGVREWNYSLRGMADRELLAAAQRACDAEVWDRCINTSDRTRNEVDMAQRFPTPFRAEVQAQARAIGLDPAYVYGLIRQESRFVMDARSGAGASGLMQIMPATARWTAKKIGLPYSAAQISDRETNLTLGTAYLKLVLDDFDGSQALAAAAYNAGPRRPRRWREGPVLEPAMWAENIPFSETRDYVKKVLSNATYYAALMSGQSTLSLRARLGRSIGPRASDDKTSDKELP